MFKDKRLLFNEIVELKKSISIFNKIVVFSVQKDKGLGSILFD